MKYLKILLAVLMVSFLIACPDDIDGPDKDAAVSFYTHPIDMRVASVMDTEGNLIELRGTKNSDGVATSIDEISVTNRKGEETVIIMKDNKPSLYYLPDGFTCQFDWDSPSSASVIITDDTGENSLHTYIDFNDLPEVEGEAKTVTRRGDIDSKIVFRETEDELPTILDTRATTKNTGIESCYLYVTRCEQPANGDCRVVVRDGITSLHGTKAIIYPVYEGTGKYRVDIPVTLQEKQFNPGEILAIINKAARGVCDSYNTMTGEVGVISASSLCGAISSALLAAGITAAIAPKFFIVCEGVLMTTEVSCAAFDAFGNATLTKLANYVHAKFDADKPLVLTPYVLGIPKNTYGSTVSTTVSGLSSVSLLVDMGGVTAIDKFYLSPSNPGRGQSYKAIANISCIGVGATVTIEIVGTDGYSNSQTEQFPAGALKQTCEMRVPGAQSSGVKDVCTITITNSDGSKLTKTASLVFGQ